MYREASGILSATVKAPKSKRSHLPEREFLGALLAGDFSRCQDLLAFASAGAATDLAQARLFLAQNRPVDVIHLLSGLRATGRQQVERDSLLAAALGLTRDFAAALHLLRAAARSAADEDLRHDIGYLTALVSWLAHDNRSAEDAATELLAAADANVRGRAHFALSWIAMRRLDVQAETLELLLALDEFDATEAPDEIVRSRVLLRLSTLAVDLPMQSVVDRIKTAYDAMVWKDGLGASYFLVTRQLGWVEALAGNDLAAFRLFREAGDHAPSDHLRVVALLDRAYLARNTGERAFASDQLHEAHKFAGGLEWDNTVEEASLVFTLFAELFADVSASIAQEYLTRYRLLSEAPSPQTVEDPRTRAGLSYSGGIAHLKLGDLDQARLLLTDAWGVFDEFHFAWRAALCALGLFEATRDEQWIERAKSRAKPWPASWIMREVQSVQRRSPEQMSIPESHQQVLDLLLSGKQNADIARLLQRSPNTVRNQIASLFRVYHVKTRAELVSVLKSGNEPPR